MRAFLAIAAIAALVGAVGVLAAALPACSAKHDPAPGEIFLAIDSNLKFPDDIDGIGISIKNELGVVSEDNVFPLGPGDGAQLPATLAVIRGTTEPITIRAVGYKGATPITVREAITTIPAGRTALLHLDLSFLDEGMVQMPANSTLVSQLTVPCGAGTTPIGGTCQSFTLDSATLPLYDPTQVGSSVGASSSVDIDDCLTGGSSVTPDDTDCTIALPSAAANVGLMLPADSPGWCNGSSCVVPLVESAADGTVGDGWMLAADGKVHLPAGVCAKGYSVFTAPVTASCPVFSLQHPAHQDYDSTSDGGAPTSDATTPIADAGSDTGAVLAPRSDIANLSADENFVYLLRHQGAETTTIIEPLPASFDADTKGTPVVVNTGAAGVTTSTAQYPLFAFAVPGPTASQILTLDLRDASATQQVFGVAVSSTSFTWTTDEQGAPNLLYLENSGGAWAHDPAGAPDASVLLDSNGISVVSTGPMDGGAISAIGEDGSQDASLTAGTLFAQHPLAPPGLPDPAELLIVDGRVVWQDYGGIMYASGPIGAADAGAVVQLYDGGVVTNAPQTFGAANHKIYWLDLQSGGLLYSATLGTTAFSTAPAPVTLSDGTQPTGVYRFVFNSTTLFWSDTNGVHRVALSALH